MQEIKIYPLFKLNSRCKSASIPAVKSFKFNCFSIMIDIPINLWLSKQKEKLDRVITNAAKRFYAVRYTTSTFSYDVGSCTKEMWALAGSSDLCYDRPSIGFCYSLWYHGNRVSSLLGIFEAAMLNGSDEQPIHIYDLGAGTGAVQWAEALIYSAMRELGIPTVPIRIINVDSSPFMIEYNQNYLSKEFLVEYQIADEIGIDFSLNNWINYNEGTIIQFLFNGYLCNSLSQI